MTETGGGGGQRLAAGRDQDTYCLITCCTWRGEPVLPGRFVIVQSLQHDIHGEHKQAGQEGVERYIEEKNQACGQRGKRVGSMTFSLIRRCDLATRAAHLLITQMQHYRF